MKIEEFFLCILFISIISVVLWYILSFYEFNTSQELSVFIAIALISLLISIAFHNKGILYSPEIHDKFLCKKSFRNGKKYRREKFSPQKVSISTAKINPFVYSRRKFKN